MWLRACVQYNRKNTNEASGRERQIKWVWPKSNETQSIDHIVIQVRFRDSILLLQIFMSAVFPRRYDGIPPFQTIRKVVIL